MVYYKNPIKVGDKVLISVCGNSKARSRFLKVTHRSEKQIRTSDGMRFTRSDVNLPYENKKQYSCVLVDYDPESYAIQDALELDKSVSQ